MSNYKDLIEFLFWSPFSNWMSQTSVKTHDASQSETRCLLWVFLWFGLEVVTCLTVLCEIGRSVSENLEKKCINIYEMKQMTEPTKLVTSTKLIQKGQWQFEVSKLIAI